MKRTSIITRSVLKVIVIIIRFMDFIKRNQLLLYSW